jgi:Fanconi anemia group M protein
MIIKRDLIEKRKYQIDIANSASKKNTLVVLPTGLGKSLIALLVAEKRLQKFPNSKIIITAPTRPLAAQHKKLFEKLTDLPKEEIALITGRIKKDKRKELYEKCSVISATPQCIRNDLKRGLINFSNFSFLVVDEAHRAVKDYPYPFIARKFIIQSKSPLILALTASPGATQERIDEICENLFIKNVEIRTEIDRDVERYVQKTRFEWVYVNLPEEFDKIRKILLEIAKDNISWLKEYGFISRKRLTKKEILSLQEKFAKRVSKKRPIFFTALRKVAHLLKIEHAIELLETQDISALAEYLRKLSASEKRSDKILMNNEKMRKVKFLVDITKKKEHPKLKKLLQIVKDIVKRNERVKIIVFANYRKTVEKICNELRRNSISSEILIGQARRGKKGLTQKKQLETLERFSNLEFNVLCGTSITEEGLDVPQVDYIIFYEPVPSEIRTIQRRGRTGRTAPGKVIFLITKKTRDEAYYWAAFRKEKKMKRILRRLQEEKTLAKRKTLLDWIKY